MRALIRQPLLRALFGTPGNAVITLLMLGAFALALPPLFRWMIGDAVWDAPNRAACLAAGSGACWAFIRARFALFFYGLYPEPERWRVEIGLVLLVIVGTGALFARRGRGWWLLALLTALPVTCGVLLAGGVFGLKPVPTPQWGGLMLNVVISFVALGGAIPLGIALAFGRRSRYPVIRILSIAMIEFWRGVPLLTVLFMGLILLPLFLPNGVTVDNLVRALVVMTLFTGAYMAETIRGGLQGVPKGQAEAATALGMHTARCRSWSSCPRRCGCRSPGSSTSPSTCSRTPRWSPSSGCST